MSPVLRVWVAFGLAGCRHPEPLAVHVTDGPGDWMVVERVFHLDGTAPFSAELVCTSPDDALEDHHLPFSGIRGSLDLQGILADTDYDCALRSTDGDELWSGSFRTDPLPEGFPQPTPSGDPELASTDDGYVLFSHWKLGKEFTKVQRLILVDGQGRVRWYLEMLDAASGGVAAALLPSGQIVAGGGHGLDPGLFSLHGDPLFQVPDAIDPADDGYTHEALVTPEGWVLSLQTVLDTGPTGTTRAGFLIQAVDPQDGEVKWSFASQPLVTDGTLPPPKSPDDDDPYHANAVSWVPDDPEGPSVWVSLRGVPTLMRIDRDTATFGGFFGPGVGIRLLDASGEETSDRNWFWGQHAPVFEGDEVLVYDNGGARPGAAQYSRVVRMRRVDADTAQVVWEWTEPGWYETNYGSVVDLPDGHVLIGTGHTDGLDPDGDASWIAEVDPGTDQVVWRFDFGTDDSLYRAQPIDGCAVFANRRFCPGE